MNFVSKIKHKIKENLFSIFQIALIALLIFLVGVFVVVMCFEDPKWSFKLFGVSGSENPKYEVLKFLGIGMGGILVALQALMSYKRAKAMEDTAKAQADAANAQADAAQAQARANEHTEQGLRQERLKNAIEHLGDERDSVRLGGAYELFHLAEDTKDLRKTALDMLCLHIRQATGENEYQEKHESKPSEEVQSLLTLLFVQNHEVFKGLQINLQGSWLNGANLREARLARAVLSGTYLRGCDLHGAYLQGADLHRADLSGGTLSGAYLREADLHEAHLQGASLNWTRLQGANLSGAYLQGTRLYVAHLQGANLGGAYLQGVRLNGAHLQGANLDAACLQGANLGGAHLQGVGGEYWIPLDSFREHIRNQIDKETDLAGAIFAGGLSTGDMYSLIEDLSDEKANELREELESHIDQPISNELPEDSGAITGAYTKEEAEQWIAEYEKVMSEVSKDNS